MLCLGVPPHVCGVYGFCVWEFHTAASMVCADVPYVIFTSSTSKYDFYGFCVAYIVAYEWCLRMLCLGVPHGGFNGVCGCMGVPRRGGVPLSSHTFSCMHLQLSSIQHLLTFSPQTPSRSSGINTIVKANYASSSADLRPAWELLWRARQVIRL